MKARVKSTGKIVEVKYSRQIGPDAVYKDLITGEYYMDFNLSFLPEDGTPDYWTRLEHQYAGMAMQGILSNANHALWDRENNAEGIAKSASAIAHALMEKYKKEEK